MDRRAAGALRQHTRRVIVPVHGNRDLKTGLSASTDEGGVTETEHFWSANSHGRQTVSTTALRAQRADREPPRVRGRACPPANRHRSQRRPVLVSTTFRERYNGGWCPSMCSRWRS